MNSLIGRRVEWEMDQSVHNRIWLKIQGLSSESVNLAFRRTVQPGRREVYGVDDVVEGAVGDA